MVRAWFLDNLVYQADSNYVRSFDVDSSIKCVEPSYDIYLIASPSNILITETSDPFYFKDKILYFRSIKADTDEGIYEFTPLNLRLTISLPIL